MCIWKPSEIQNKQLNVLLFLLCQSKAIHDVTLKWVDILHYIFLVMNRKMYVNEDTNLWELSKTRVCKQRHVSQKLMTDVSEKTKQNLNLLPFHMQFIQFTTTAYMVPSWLSGWRCVCLCVWALLTAQVCTWAWIHAGCTGWNEKRGRLNQRGSLEMRAALQLGADGNRCMLGKCSIIILSIFGLISLCKH